MPITRRKVIIGAAAGAGIAAAGPAAGEMVAQLVPGQATTVDPKPYRYERYIDGAAMRFTA